MIYTEGVRFLAEEAAAFWLLDAIASYFGSSVMNDALARDDRLADIQFWTLTVTGQVASLVMVADVGEEPAIPAGDRVHRLPVAGSCDLGRTER